jgi:hypothetical protein
MSTQPDTIPQEQVIEQVKLLTEQKQKLSNHIEQLELKGEQLEASLSENGNLAERVKALSNESLALFDEEWKRRTAFYPDIHVASLEQTLLIVQPPKKKP